MPTPRVAMQTRCFHCYETGWGRLLVRVGVSR
jgi:hypothetical protein